MTPVRSQALYQEALACLREHKHQVGAGFKGRFIQMFLGMKFFQNSIPSMYSGSFITTELIQSLLDDVYSKASRPANDSILSLFEGRYLARTGLTAPNNNTPQNTWRNNFNLQKGIGCYADPADLSSMTFLNEDRTQCRYLQQTTGTDLAGGRCSLCPTGAAYRSENHRKWLRIDPSGNGYAVADLQNINNFLPYVAASGHKIPIIPLIVALYYDADPGLVTGTRTTVSVNEFAMDFNFSSQEILAYFDVSLSNPLNQRITQSAAWVSGGVIHAPAIIYQTPVTTAPVVTQPNLGTPTPPPGVNSGWEAEQYVAFALNSSGWNAYVVSRQLLGYDIFAQRGRQKLYVEVKSSLGLCSPSLTAREWQQAKHYQGDYVLAVIEHFKPAGLNNIYWVKNPAISCTSTQQTSVSYVIPRSSWVLAVVDIAHI
ncbi:protein NO VEIN domain-containing protein [Aeromonas caviae]|uniref:protein NO VEIN domain-containing protein n=1 Tax=Aeromonas caviae TaxID=648 RepID=UPI002B4A1071|nr:DUF3883 domain-containing protein [Aeromonas caviae]